MPFDLPSDTQEMTLNLGTPPVSAPVKHTVVPQAYYPGADAPVRIAQENSFWGNFTTALQNAGTQPGEIPVSMKMRLAQQQADINISQDKLAWENYHRANDAFNETVRLHNQNAAEHALTLFPNAKAQIRNASTPEEAQALAAFHGKALESLLPGAQDYMVKYGATRDSMAAGDAFDIVLASPTYGPLMKPLVDNLGYLQASQLPQVKAWGEIVGRDTITNVVSHMPESFITKLTTGKVGEEEFRKEYENNLLDPSMKFNAQSLSHAKQALNSEIGQQMMIGMGVKTNAVAEKQQLKGPTSGNPMNQAKYAELLRVQNDLQHAQDNPDAYTKQEIDKLKEREDILLRVKSPQGSPGESVSNTFSHSLVKISGGKMQTASDLAEFKPGTTEYSQALKWIDKANEEAKTAGAQATLQAHMQTPADVTSRDVFSRNALKAGNLRMVGPQTEQQLRTNPDNIQLKPDEQTKFVNLTISQNAGKSLFDQAEKIFKATTGPGLAGQSAKWAMFDSALTRPVVAASNPEMATYHDSLEAWAGNNAKALGGEVGVLTNTDINRWVRTFPAGGDTPTIITAKRNIFNEMVKLVRTVRSNVLLGEMTPAYDASGYIVNPEVRQKIEGLIGSAEGLSAKSANSKPKVDRGQSLLEKMKAE